jgi:hypothetical protein
MSSPFIVLYGCAPTAAHGGERMRERTERRASSCSPEASSLHLLEKLALVFSLQLLAMDGVLSAIDVVKQGGSGAPQ